MIEQQKAFIQSIKLRKRKIRQETEAEDIYEQLASEYDEQITVAEQIIGVYDAFKDEPMKAYLKAGLTD